MMLYETAMGGRREKHKGKENTENSIPRGDEKKSEESATWKGHEVLETKQVQRDIAQKEECRPHAKEKGPDILKKVGT